MNLIAEISSNHNQDFDRVKQLIDLAVRNNFHSVKFQLFKIEKLFSNEILKISKMHRDRKNWELPEDFLPMIYKYCRKNKIKVGYSPFYVDAVKLLNSYTDYFKIASYELLWHDLIFEVLKTQKPLMISTGMATLDEVRSTLEIIPRNYPLTVFHCSSSYPTKAKNSNLASIESLKLLLNDMCFKNFEIGWSDHTKIISVVARAFHRFDAQFAEIHIDLDDEKGYEFGAGHCWTERQIKGLINATKFGKISDGLSIKTTNSEEESDRLWRRDPKDGLRPYFKARSVFKNKS